MSEHLPFMSIVVITYNGASNLPAILNSLINQSYPDNSYEIILVDDGSTDNTPDIAKEFPTICYVRHTKNKGISAARNAGLNACRGDIYVSFDDDCIAESDWLYEIARGYTLGNPVGVGGMLMISHSRLGITSRYLSMCDYYLGPRQLYADEQNLSAWHRLRRYLMTGLRPPLQAKERVEVDELYGANSSFPCVVLKAVGGWRTEMSGIEDRDLSHRIREEFPGRPFYQISNAKLMHTGQHRLGQYLMRPLRRGAMNLSFYRNANLFPPIFPFPIIFLTASVLAADSKPFLILPVFLILPPLMYFWWPYRAVKHRRLIAVCFAYIQLIEETMVMLGLLRGYFQLLIKPGVNTNA
jgi:glycosyltransferase involved in cell wall biosynthesis